MAFEGTAGGLGGMDSIPTESLDIDAGNVNTGDQGFWQGFGEYATSSQGVSDISNTIASGASNIKTYDIYDPNARYQFEGRDSGPDIMQNILSGGLTAPFYKRDKRRYAELQAKADRYQKEYDEKLSEIRAQEEQQLEVEHNQRLQVIDAQNKFNNIQNSINKAMRVLERGADTRAKLQNAANTVFDKTNDQAMMSEMIQRWGE